MAGRVFRRLGVALMADSAFKVELTYRGQVINRPEDRPEGVPVRAWRAILKHTNLTMAQHWHKMFLPKHFGPEAGRRYKGVYKKRTSGHERRKERQRGLAAANGRDYLRFTGRLEQRVTQQVAFRVFPTRVRIHMASMFYIPKRPKGNRPNIHAELTAVNVEELKVLKQVGRRALLAAIGQYRATGALPGGLAG